MKAVRYRDHNWLVHRINNRLFQSQLPLIRGRVLDLGCGTAPYRDDIVAIADEYVGVDWPNSLHDARNVDVCADLSQSLPFDDGSADTVVAFQVLEHLREPGRFLSEAYRVLRPGGNLVLTVPFMWRVHEAPHDYYRFTRHGLEHLLQAAGFSDLAIDEASGFFQMMALKLNYMTFPTRRRYLRAALWPLWMFDQTISPILDRLRRCPAETISYVASGCKAASGSEPSG